MASVRRMVVLAGLVIVGNGVQAQDSTDLRTRWYEAVNRRGTIQIERDSVPALDLKVRRVTGFRCFDCNFAHTTLLIHNSDSALVADTADLSNAWRVIQFNQPRGGEEFRDQVVTLLKLSCIPGCRVRTVTSALELEEGFRVFLAPAESLTALRPPSDGARAGALWTKFFVSSENGISLVAAVLKDEELFVSVRTVAAFQRS